MPIVDDVRKINCLPPDSISTVDVCKAHTVSSYLECDTITKCPVCAYQIRRIALYADFQEANQYKKSKWLRLWLRHCLSKETDYIFQVLKVVKDKKGEEVANVDRETDVKTIADKYLKEDAPLAKHIGSSEGVKFYKKTIADWFLRQYNRKEAKKILSSDSFNGWDKLKLFYPRMIVAIIVGLLALMTGQEMWNLPHELSYSITSIIYGPITKFFGWHLPYAYSNLVGFIGLLVIVCFFYVLSVLYLCYECYNIIFDTKKARCRAIKVGGQGLFASLILSTLICYAIGPISGTEAVINPDTYRNLQSGLPIFKNIIFFASVALFIGIFMQVFWEKETITEPL